MNKLNNINAILQGPTSLNAQIADIKMAPPDPILGTSIAFQKDKDANKINLGVGAYRDSNGKPYVFEIVKKIESSLHTKALNHVCSILLRNIWLLMDFLNMWKQLKILSLDREMRLLKMEELLALKLFQELEQSASVWKLSENSYPELYMFPNQLGVITMELFKKLVYLWENILIIMLRPNP